MKAEPKSKFKKHSKSTHFTLKKKFCRFCVDKVNSVDYKDTKRLEAFLTEKGKIVSRRYSGNCAIKG